MRLSLQTLKAASLRRCAHARAPPTLRTRYEAESRADLAALSGRRLAVPSWALGLRRASRQLRRTKAAILGAMLPFKRIDGDALCDRLKDHQLGLTVRKRVVEDVDIDDAFWDQLA